MKHAPRTGKEAGTGQLIAVVAEAGTGQVAARIRVQGEAAGRVQSAGSLFGVARARSLPGCRVLELLHIYFGIEGVDDLANARRDKVSTKLAALSTSALSDRLPYLFGLLGIQESPDPLVQMDPQIRRQRTA